MTNALLLGSAIGAILGLAHAWGIYARQRANPARAAYFAAWTLFLWVLLGSYVLFLWIVSIPIFAVALGLKSIAKPNSPQ